VLADGQEKIPLSLDPALTRGRNLEVVVDSTVTSMTDHAGSMVCRMMALIWLIVFLSGCSVFCQQPIAARLVVFGDSNADNGNLYRLSGGSVPSPPRWNGRESNGPVAVEYLATALGVPLLDYAVSGATTGRENVLANIVPGLRHVEHTGVEEQIGTFLQKERFLPGDVVILWAGSNDLALLDGDSGKAMEARLSHTALNLEHAIQRLVANGALSVVVVNRLPRRDLDSGDDHNGRRMNEAISRAVIRMRQLLPARIALFDAYAKVAEMIRDPDRFGFSEVRLACLDTPVCAPTKGSGNKASGFVHWDRYHKTTRVHQLLAQALLLQLARSE
jgi:cholinesterase